MNCILVRVLFCTPTSAETEKSHSVMVAAISSLACGDNNA